jgi:serine/threonine protein kinase
LGAKLGAGVFGTVFGASGPQGVPLAVKEQVISFRLGVKNFKDRLLRYISQAFMHTWVYSLNHLINARFYAELNVLMLTSCQPRIITTYGGDVVVDGNKARCYIVMARVPRTLADYLKAEGATMSPVKSLEIVFELVEIAEVLQSMEIAHGDIKV